MKNKKMISRALSLVIDKEEWYKIKWKDDEMKIEKGTQKTKTKRDGN